MSLTFLTFFVTEWTGVSPTLMATVYTFARFADLGVQMFAGGIIQRQKRVRPWLIALPIVSQLGTIVSFTNPDVDLWLKLVVLIVGYCMIHFPMNFLTVTTNTLLMKVSGPNPANRMAITTAMLRGGNAMRIITSAVSMPLILFFLSQGLPGYLIVSVIYGCITVIAASTLFVATAPYETKEASSAPAATAVTQTSFVKMYAAAFKNRPILILLIATTITGIGNQVFAAGLMYYWRYSVGSLTWQPIGTTIASIVALGWAVIMPSVAKRIGKRKTFLFHYCWSFAMFTSYLLFADGNPIAYIIINGMAAMSASMTMSWGIQLYLDSAEIQLYESGVDNRPFLMSLNNLPIKLGFIVSGPFVALMLNNSGYFAVDGVGYMADTGRFMFIWLALPMAGFMLAGLFFFFGYRINETYASEAAAANAKAQRERMEAAAAAAAGGGGPGGAGGPPPGGPPAGGPGGPPPGGPPAGGPPR
jgi:Na+/melibiose symporter-like transporter